MALEAIENFDQITLVEASVLTRNWQKENFLKAFLFHKNDIKCLAQEEGVIGVRFYIGITKNEDEDDMLDMIVVGVNSENQDVIISENEPKDLIGISGIYDFALPCPKLCDPESDLFHLNVNTAKNYTTKQVKTVQHSTENECNIELGEITEQEAIDRVKIWQCDMEKSLISVLFNIESLDAIFREFNQANALRVYFGLEDGAHRVLLIGASDSSENEAYYKDIMTPFIYVNTNAPCTGNGESSCDINSILYRPCNL